MANEVIEKAKDNMKKSIAVFQKELGGIRAGVANASLELRLTTTVFQLHLHKCLV